MVDCHGNTLISSPIYLYTNWKDLVPALQNYVSFSSLYIYHSIFIFLSLLVINLISFLQCPTSRNCAVGRKKLLKIVIYSIVSEIPCWQTHNSSYWGESYCQFPHKLYKTHKYEIRYKEKILPNNRNCGVHLLYKTKSHVFLYFLLSFAINKGIVSVLVRLLLLRFKKMNQDQKQLEKKTFVVQHERKPEQEHKWRT